MIDLKHFRKVGVTPTHTIMQHPDGHVIHIAHNSLEPELKKELKAIKMSDGGEVKNSNEKLHPQEGPKKPPEPMPLSQDQMDRAKEISKGFKGAMGFADGTPQGTVGDEAAYRARFVNAGFQGTPAGEEMAATEVSPSPDISLAPPTQQQSPLENPNIPQPSNEPNPIAKSYADYAKNVQEGLGQRVAGTEAEAAALGELGKQKATAATTQIHDEQQVLNTYNQKIQELDQHRQNLEYDIANSHVDPNRLVGSQDTVGKISTAIGLILGGIGGGVTGQGNPALKFLGDQIDRDINAQRIDLGKKENLLSATLRQYGNYHDALQATRATMLDLAAARLQQAEGTSQDPLARARAQQAIGQLKQESAGILSQIALKQSIMEHAGAGKDMSKYAGAIIENVVPKEQQGEVTKQFREASETARFAQELNRAYDTVYNLKLGGVFSPRVREAAIAPLVAALEKKEAGRFSELGSKMLETVFPPKGLSSEAAKQTARNTLNNLIKRQANFPQLDYYGINPAARLNLNFTPKK